jgi:DNA-binding transcriptional LysR family regulator
MSRIVQWEHQIGRRLRLRDLSVFFTVVESGSMAKAAAQLGVSTPAISDVIAGLEHALGVRLLDRTPKGVLTTPYGHALLARGRAAFDELRQGIKDIEFISDPGAGELRIGCPESIAAGFLLPIVERLSKRYPRVSFHVEQVHNPTVEFPELQERKVDLVLARLVKPPMEGRLSEELNAEVLFDDPFSLVVCRSSRLARRRKVDLADLVDEPWIMTPLDALGGLFVTEAFRIRGLKVPKLTVTTFSIHMRNNLVSSGRFITALPASVLRLNGRRYSLKELPIELSTQPSPVAIVTLRNRTLGPAVQLFIECAREVAKSFAGRPQARKT